MTKAFSSDIAAFVFKHVLCGFVKATGHRVPVSKDKSQNIQCVKLTKEHTPMVQMVAYWCNLRSIKLKQMGMTDVAAAVMNRRDADFLTLLAGAIMEQQEKSPQYDAWLFFDSDVQSTPFFELQKCDRGTKNARCTTMIFADR